MTLESNVDMFKAQKCCTQKTKKVKVQQKLVANENFDQTMSISFEAHKWSTQ